MKVLLLGSTGLLGQAMAAETKRRGFVLRDAARNRARIPLDVTDDKALLSVLGAEIPDLVVNCAANVDLDDCEKNPLGAYRLNARPLAFLAEWSRTSGKPLVQISTDHYFNDGGNAPHDEAAPVSLVNEYARTKFAGEAFALTAPRALVLRTNIVGIRGWGKPTFAEWVIGVALGDNPATMFSDVYVSSIDVSSFARATFDLIATGTTGLLNLAAREVYAKEAFIREIARQLNCPMTRAKSGPAGELHPRRANCLGLNVSRAETLLGYRLPDLRSVVTSVLTQYRQRSCAQLTRQA